MSYSHDEPPMYLPNYQRHAALRLPIPLLREDQDAFLGTLYDQCQAALRVASALDQVHYPDVQRFHELVDFLADWFDQNKSSLPEEARTLVVLVCGHWLLVHGQDDVLPKGATFRCLECEQNAEKEQRLLKAQRERKDREGC